jgi:hypothetical protein
MNSPKFSLIIHLIIKKLLYLTAILSVCEYSIAQDIGAYSDYQGHFFIFDHGKNIKAEDLLVQSFAIGGECILYINSQGHLKMYKNGTNHELEVGGVTNYYATDHLAAYSVYEKLKVVDNKGQVVTLSSRCPLYRVEDSLIVFYDKNLESLRIYYKEEVSDIESGLIGMPVSKLSSGDNIVAYISSRSKDFKIWYNGINHTILKYVESLSFKAGKDLVAYVNRMDNTFHVYYKDNDFLLDNFVPKSYKVGDGFVAYISYSDGFKVFYNGEIIAISGSSPDAYYAEDNLMIISESGYFKVFYSGQVYELEAYVPKVFKMDWNSIAYLDNSNRIWFFSKGEKEYLLNDLINSYTIYRDLIIMNAKVDRNIIYYNGEFYEGLSY